MLSLQIQPYFPEPLTVNKSVASERYVVRLSFIRAVLAGHVISVVAISSVAMIFEHRLAVGTLVGVFLGGLLMLTLVRWRFRGRSLDGVISLFLLVPVLWSAGCFLRTLGEGGEPVWILASGYVALVTYGALCGRDYSFVGQFVLATTALTVAVSIGMAVGGLSLPQGISWWLLTEAFLLYVVYDLAALLSRRRLGEETASVADLYRDLLNFTTYAFRIVLHWRRFGPI